MRKIAVIAALATTALAGPAVARDGAWYAGIDAGGMIMEDIDYDLKRLNGTEVSDAYQLSNEKGFDVAGTIGYDFGAFRGFAVDSEGGVFVALESVGVVRQKRNTGSGSRFSTVK